VNTLFEPSEVQEDAYRDLHHLIDQTSINYALKAGKK
jgi:hypothetical protein